MRIFADKFQLADHGQIEFMELNSERMLQIDEGPRWKEIKVRDRKNDRTEISFRVNRLHASLNACERYFLEHARNIPRRPATFLMIADFGGARAEMKLLNAGISVVRQSYWGATSMHTYQVVGGIIV